MGARSMVAGVQARALEPEIRRVGAELAAAFPSPARHPLRALDEKAMELSARDDALRAALFRFVDVVPACRSLDDLAVHLTGYLDELPARTPPLEGAMRMAHTRAGRAALGAAAAAGVKHMANRFIVGETPRAVTGELRALWRRGVAMSVDLLGEATVTAAEADRYAQRCHEALEVLADASRDWPVNPALERDSGGTPPRANVSVKGSAPTPPLPARPPPPGPRRPPPPAP